MIAALKRRALSRSITATLSAVAALSSQPANAQSRPGECRFVLELPTTRLYVDKAWLDASQPIVPLNEGSCPRKPIQVKSFYFGREVLNVLGIGGGIGRQWFRLYLEAASDVPLVPAPSDPVWRQPVDASIQMQLIDPNDAKSRASRFYAILYSSTSKPLSGEARVNCGGEEPTQRHCTVAPYPEFAGLTIRYEFSQSKLPVPNITAISPETEPGSADPNTEPGAILQFDRRLREWLVRIEQGF